MHLEKQTKELLKLPAQEVKDWLSNFDAILTDCDGVLWLYSDVIEGSIEVVNKFIHSGRKVYFITNNSTKTREEFLSKAQQMGFCVDTDKIISTAHLAANYLKRMEFNKTVYIIGSSGIKKELDAVGISSFGVGPDTLNGGLKNLVDNELKRNLNSEVGAVIVGFDEHFSFPKLAKATSYLNNAECLFLATNTDERFPMTSCVIPGTGSIVRSVETAAERPALVMGKPNTACCKHLIDDQIIVPERTLMIGDRCNTDILLGTNCGFQTLLVGTGVHKMEDVQKWQKSGTAEEKKLIPDAYLPRLGDLLQFIDS